MKGKTQSQRQWKSRNNDGDGALCDTMADRNKVADGTLLVEYDKHNYSERDGGKCWTCVLTIKKKHYRKGGS